VGDGGSAFPSDEPPSSSARGDERDSWSLFQVHGVEIEYAIVRRDSLAVDASADRLLEALGGDPDAHPASGNVEADNELAAHVLELKLRRPVPDPASQAGDFAAAVRAADRALARWGCRLMPGGMHPFMDPSRESGLWTHEDSEIYRAYDRVFGVRGHGWFNIQSTHLNLPFRGDAEFARLHSAVSLLLPLLPALAASSPFHDGAHHGWLSGRLLHYVGNQKRLPEIIGGVVPEPAGSESEYRERILEPMYRAIAPYDPDGLLQEEWLNSRAAIARFSRGSVEIRCLDSQEGPTADLALCGWAAKALQYMLGNGGDPLARHRHVPAGLLKALFLDTARQGGAAPLPAGFPCAAFGLEAAPTVGGFLRALTDRIFPAAGLSPGDASILARLDLILTQGTLAQRLLAAAGPDPDRGRLRATYAGLCECLHADSPFRA
jgi:carboxylate-amine ligase